MLFDINSLLVTGSDGEVRLDRARARKLAAELAGTRAEVYSTDEGKKKALSNYNKAISSGSAGIAALSAIEGDYHILNIFRDVIALDFMEIRPLPLGTIPIFRTRTLNPVGLQTGSVAGGGSTVYWATKDAGVQVFPFSWSTEKVMTPNLNNIYDMVRLGQRKEAKEALDRYVRIGKENIALNTVFNPGTTGSVVTDDPAVSIATYFAGGGSFAGKSVYTLDPGVVTAAVPSVNVYDLTTEGGLTKKVFQTVNTHSMQIGRNFNRMYIPQAAVASKAPMWESLQNMATPVALITGAGLNNSPAAAVPAEMWSEFQKEDFRGEIVIDWFGLRVSVRKQNWMPAGYCILFCDQPAGLMWNRLTLESGQPQDGVLVQPVDGYYSYESVTMNDATARPDWALRNFLVIKAQ